MSFFVLLLLLMMVAAGFVVAFARRSSARRITEPSCGKCGYCVRGLESMTCPECGSDLREVGILTPASHKPASILIRLTGWILIAPLPALILAQVAAAFLTPWQATTNSRRVIFLQADYLNTTLNVTAEGRQTVYRRTPGVNVPLQEITIAMARGNAMFVDLKKQTATYHDSAGKPISGAFDEKAIAAWLKFNGHNDPRVAERAADILTLVNEVPAGVGSKFSYLAHDPGRGNMPLITAHPASPLFTQYRPTLWHDVVPWAVGIAVILAGIPVVIYLHRRVQSRSNADQARAHP